MRDLDAQVAFIAAKQHEIFDYGTWDCGLLARGAVKALTGEDKLAGIDVWKDEKTAMRYLAKRGGLFAAVSAVLDDIPVSMAMRGDIGAVEGAAGPMLVVIEGMTLVGTGLGGLERLPRRHLVKAWSAGA